MDLMVLFLMQEMKLGDKSLYKSYIDASMPSDYSVFPVNYTEDEKAIIEGSDGYELICKLPETYKTHFEGMCEVSEEIKKEFTLDDYVKAKCATDKNVFLYRKDDFDLLGFIPFADIVEEINEFQNVKWMYDHAKKGFVMAADRDIRMGEALLIGKRPMSNLQYLIGRGKAYE